MPLHAVYIDHTQIAVPTTLEAERMAFYRQMFSFPDIPKPRELQGRCGAWFQVGGRQLHICVDPELLPQSERHIGFLTADLAIAKIEVLADGIRIDQTSVAGGVSWFFIRYPAGNRIEIGQRT
ncbi:MAG TPA: hypothetical protein VHW69_10610 [Rhizomicrobium sp.]|jgi:hypothetical protein|nr:hypothetical protein [Rhizomicrobium sp.]